MLIITENFEEIVAGAYSGKFVLPEFQRDWKWNSPKVLRLFDSIRKGYPIGGFLTLAASGQLPTSSRSFKGVNASEDMELRLSHMSLTASSELQLG